MTDQAFRAVLVSIRDQAETLIRQLDAAAAPTVTPAPTAETPETVTRLVPRTLAPQCAHPLDKREKLQGFGAANGRWRCACGHVEG